MMRYLYSPADRTRPATLPFILSVLVLLAVPAPAPAQDVEQLGTVVGPERGTLLAVGGAMESAEIYRTFIELAGGPGAHLVMIPTAGGEPHYDHRYPGLNAWREHGARNLTVLHTTDPAVADTEAFVEPLASADGVFFFGGRQWRLVEAYAGTRTEEAIRRVLDRGGVVGGTSAGASIQGSYLVRGDTRTNQLVMGDHQEGFGYLRGVGIDQHVLRRNRHFDLLELVQARPELLGIGLDEDTAIVVRGDRFEVIGRSYVVIYDPETVTDAGGGFYFLAPGDEFDLASRRAVRPSETLRAVPGVQPRSPEP
ncbi:MAG: cyanophycinase [Gemmatimonadota bacterium]|nr:cyanophycinase [Gemmatimonadota bacterium]